MHLILLPGNSSGNKEWAEAVLEKLRPNFDSALVHYYSHWNSGDGLIDVDGELAVLSKKIPDGEYAIFAKSAGVVLALKGMCEKIFAPARCVFVGLPAPWARENRFDIDAWTLNYATPTLFIQQSADPAMPFDDLKEYLIGKNIKNGEFEKISGNDHDYADIDRVCRRALEFINKKPRT